MSAFFAGIYVAKKRTKSIGLTTIIAALINLAVDFMLVVPLGITAGSLSTAVSYLFLSLYRMFDIKKTVAIKYDYKLMILCTSILMLMGVLSLQRNIVCDIINVAIGVSLCIYWNRKLLSNIFKSIMRKMKKSKSEVK